MISNHLFDFGTVYDFYEKENFNLPKLWHHN